MSRPGAREWAARLLLLLLSAGIALVAAEVGLRLFLAPRFTTIYRIHEEHLHEHIPGRTKLFTHLEVNGGHSVLVRTNSEGYRGAELLPAGRATRVVVFGDSMVAAEYSDLGHTFVEQLESRLAALLKREVEGINAGVVGYGPDQVSLRMEADLDLLQPDLAVVVLFADNDFGDLLRNKLYRLDGGGELRRQHPILALHLREEFEEARSSPMLVRVLSDALWWRDSRRIDPLEDVDPAVREFERMAVWLEAARRDYAGYLASGDVVTNLMMDTYDADLSLEPSGRSASLKAVLMEAVLSKISTTASGAGVPLVFVIVPSARDLCPSYDYGRIDPARYPDYRPRGLSDALGRPAALSGAPTLNLFTPFVERGGCGLYFRGGEDHWNGAGQALAADRVAEFIVSTDTLP